MEKRKNFSSGAILLFSTIFCGLLVDLCVIIGTRFSVRDKQLFEISEVEITRVDCNSSVDMLFRHKQIISIRHTLNTSRQYSVFYAKVAMMQIATLLLTVSNVRN